MSAAESNSSRSRRILEGTRQMTSKHYEELMRISAESHELTRSAHASCQDSAEHIRQSREAIGRSLRLLGERFHNIRD